MRHIRKPLLVSLVLAAAISHAASTASAAPSEITMSNEVGGLTCSVVMLGGHDVNGGCLLHATGSATFKKHVFGIESTITTCIMEFHLRVGIQGSGWILEQQMLGENCTRKACEETEMGEKDPWQVSSIEGDRIADLDPDQPEGTEFMTTQICLKPTAGGAAHETCEVDVPFNRVGSSHLLEFGHEAAELPGHAIGQFRCEVALHWITETVGMHDGESETSVEVTHAG